MKRPKTIYITERDWERLERMVSGAGKAPNIAKLRNELDQATVVPSEKIPSDVVTMNSRVSFQELDTGEKSEITLVYPSDADINRRRISILAPVGAALIGLRVGDEIEWPLPSGRTRTYKIISVLFQPEAEGRYDL
jgi:regulator of nucleoside diphosphate kinase